MTTLALHHASVLVQDLDRSKHFYEDVLGLLPAPNRPAKPFDGIWYDVGPGQIHLIVAEAAGEGSVPGAYPGRQRHIALKVGNLEVLKERLAKAGVATTASQSGRPVVFCRDPDGNILELMAG